MSKRHLHDWSAPIAGTTFLGFFSWETRTRIVRTCTCGKIKVRSIPGAWRNAKGAR